MKAKEWRKIGGGDGGNAAWTYADVDAYAAYEVAAEREKVRVLVEALEQYAHQDFCVAPQIHNPKTCSNCIKNAALAVQEGE